MASNISEWRKHAAYTIREAISNCKTSNPGDIKKAIDAAYPFGVRAYHPYKIWLSERRIALEALGIVTPKSKNKRLPDYGNFNCKWCRDLGCLVCKAKK